MKRIIVAGTLIMALTLSMFAGTEAEAAMPKMNKKTATVTVGQKVKLKVKGAKKKVKWTSSKKSVASVKSTGKATATVTTKKDGKATITAKVGGKKCTCKVKVNKKQGAKKEQTDTKKEWPDTMEGNYGKMKSILSSKANNSVSSAVSSNSNVKYSISYKPSEQAYYFDMNYTITRDGVSKTVYIQLLVKESSLGKGDITFKLEDNGNIQELNAVGIPLTQISGDSKVSWSNTTDEKLTSVADIATCIAFDSWKLWFLEVGVNSKKLGFGA